MRIVRLDNMKCGAVVYNHRNKLRILIKMSIPSTLLLLKQMTLSGKLRCHQNLNSCAVKRTIAYCRGKRCTQNEVHNRSFPVDTQVRLELVAKEFGLMTHRFVDILLVQTRCISFAVPSMANNVCRARSLHRIKKAPVCRALAIGQNSQDDSTKSFLFLDNA
jgi:hypothetical protein